MERENFAVCVCVCVGLFEREKSRAREQIKVKESRVEIILFTINLVNTAVGSH